MQGNIVSLFKYLIVSSGLLNGSGQMPCTVDGDVRIASDNVHTKGFGSIGYQAADGAQADYAQSFTHDLVAGESGLAFLDGLCHVGSQGVCPLNTAYDVTGSQHESGYCQLLYSVCVGTGRIEYDDAFFSTTVYRDVIDTGTGTTDCFQGSAELHIVHSRGADKDCIRIRNRITNLVCIVKLFQTYFGNLVQKLNLSHNCVLDYLGFFSANSFMNATSFSTPS